MTEAETIDKLQLKIQNLQRELEFNRTEYERKEAIYRLDAQVARENERILHTLVETAVGDIGQDFFNNIVIKLSEWLNAEIVLIGRMIEPNKITALPLFYDGRISEGFTYDLANSPCDITTQKGYCSFSENVINLFPKDKLLVDMNAEGYIGIALYNTEGFPNGVICAVSRKRLQIPSRARDILKIIGARVTAEIERKKAEEALKNSETELKEINATKDKFFSIIAHDLKGPFQTILGFSELLLDNYNRYEEEKRLKYIELIYRSGIHTHGLLENLLVWSRSQRGVMSYSPVRIELSSFVEKNIRVIKKMADEKSLTLNINIPENIVINADADMLATILRNLLSNAIKFTKENGQVTLSGMYADGDNCKGMVIISIEDTGVGIEEYRLKELFNDDKIEPTPGTNTEMGTGLGLMLCKEFVERHNGKITVDSKVGTGSTFTISLNAN